MRELPFHEVRSDKISSKRKERLVSKERLILTFSGEVWYAELSYHGGGSENRNQLGSKRKERLVTKERLILTFSGEVRYAGITVPGTGE
jgi:hypothetical protein